MLPITILRCCTPDASSLVLGLERSVGLGECGTIRYLGLAIWLTEDRPLYNAELSAPELRGFLVSFYQFATILGIMLSFWVGYGSNYIGGIGDGQSNLAWRLPSIIQGIPAICLALGIWWLPFSPRWLVKQGRHEEALRTIAYLRKLPADNELVLVEFKEIQAECLFEERAFAKAFPKLAQKEKGNIWMHEIAQYFNIVRTKDNFYRVSTAWLVMFFQQWSGIDAVRSAP